MNGETFYILVANQRMLYERHGRVGARPSTNFIGFRNGLPVVSVSCCPRSVRDMVEKFTGAGMLLSSVQVDEACFAVGDEWAEMVLHPDELPLPADGYAAVLAAGCRPRGVLRPYQYDREVGKVTWGVSIDLRLSLQEGLWAEILAPQCLDGDGPGREFTTDVAGVVALNREMGNDVLIVDDVLPTIGAGSTLN